MLAKVLQVLAKFPASSWPIFWAEVMVWQCITCSRWSFCKFLTCLGNISCFSLNGSTFCTFVIIANGYFFGHFNTCLGKINWFMCNKVKWTPSFPDLPIHNTLTNHETIIKRQLETENLEDLPNRVTTSKQQRSCLFHLYKTNITFWQRMRMLRWAIE